MRTQPPSSLRAALGQRRAAIPIPGRRPVLLVAALLLGGLCGAGCGSGGGDDGAPTLGTAVLINNPLARNGAANAHAILSVTYVRAGDATGPTTLPLTLPPGGQFVLRLPAGPYSLSVRYDDGRPESLQTPADQVTLFSNDSVEVRFLY